MRTFQSEDSMADMFQRLISGPSVIRGCPQFGAVYREVTCRQGIADFVAIAGTRDIGASGLVTNLPSATLNSCALLISLLKKRSLRTEEYLSKASGLSLKRVQLVLGELVEVDIVKRATSGAYLLGDSWVTPRDEVWAFELKLENWRRALFQALQYRAFAHKVSIVLPRSKQSVVSQNLELFRKTQVGVLLLDPQEEENEFVVYPTKSRPSSSHHNLFVLGQISRSQALCDSDTYDKTARSTETPSRQEAMPVINAGL